jgi:hypothetical protein
MDGAWGLPTRPTKASDTRAKNFGEISVELDAIEPNQLRVLVQETIERHLPGLALGLLGRFKDLELLGIARLVGKITPRRRQG